MIGVIESLRDVGAFFQELWAFLQEFGWVIKWGHGLYRVLVDWNVQ